MRKINRNVFVNCPFDDDYLPIFQAVVFTVEACGFSVRSALESSNSGETRIEKIVRIIRESPFGIHDISRTELNESGLPRFNMPFELGLFLGMRAAGGRHARKNALVLDRDRYRYQQFLSDLAGHDIGSHNNRVDDVIEVVRNWLTTIAKQTVPGPKRLKGHFHSFQAAIPAMLKSRNLSHHELNHYPDFYETVRSWIEDEIEWNG